MIDSEGESMSHPFNLSRFPVNPSRKLYRRISEGQPAIDSLFLRQFYKTRYCPVMTAGRHNIPRVKTSETERGGEHSGVVEGEGSIHIGRAHCFICVKQQQERGPEENEINLLTHLLRHEIELIDPLQDLFNIRFPA